MAGFTERRNRKAHNETEWRSTERCSWRLQDVTIGNGHYPGYQCPICNRQVGEFLSKSKEFAEARAQVVIVHPGPADKLADHADEFIRDKTLPANFHLVIWPAPPFLNQVV